MAYSSLAVRLDATVCETRHVAGVDNVVYDGLSRGKTPAELGLSAELEVVLDQNSLATQYLLLCDPHSPIGGATEHSALAANFVSLLNSHELVTSSTSNLSLD